MHTHTHRHSRSGLHTLGTGTWSRPCVFVYSSPLDPPLHSLGKNNLVRGDVNIWWCVGPNGFVFTCRPIHYVAGWQGRPIYCYQRGESSRGNKKHFVSKEGNFSGPGLTAFGWVLSYGPFCYTHHFRRCSNLTGESLLILCYSRVRTTVHLRPLLSLSWSLSTMTWWSLMIHATRSAVLARLTQPKVLSRGLRLDHCGVCLWRIDMRDITLHLIFCYPFYFENLIPKPWNG